jgi:acyl carrier protein
MALRDDLMRFLVEQGVDLSDHGDDSEDLLESGRLDSLALFNLVCWVEERTGVPVDPTQFDLMREWSSVRGILTFMSERGRPAR